MLHIPDCDAIFEKVNATKNNYSRSTSGSEFKYTLQEHYEGISEILSDLSRPRKRLSELLATSATEKPTEKQVSKPFLFPIKKLLYRFLYLNPLLKFAG